MARQKQARDGGEFLKFGRFVLCGGVRPSRCSVVSCPVCSADVRHRLHSHVLLFNETGFLGSNGMVDSRVVLMDGSPDSLPSNWRDCVFRLQPAGQYYAREELTEYLLQLQHRHNTTDPRLALLEQACENEDGFNRQVAPGAAVAAP